MKIQTSAYLASIAPLFLFLIVVSPNLHGVGAEEERGAWHLRASSSSTPDESLDLGNGALERLLAIIGGDEPAAKERSKSGPISNHETKELRILQEDQTADWVILPKNHFVDWVCVRPSISNDHYGTVKISGGAQQGDATRACNERLPQCEGGCTALAIKSSVWNCYTQDPIQFQKTVELSWGHEGSDAAWSCNLWKPGCESGRCFGMPVYYVDKENNRTWSSSGNSCSGNGGTCNAVKTDEYSITLATFKNDDTFAEVMGCGEAFSWTGSTVNSEGVDVQFGTTKTYQEWEGCCAAVGETLQLRGLLSDGWKCAKDANNGAVQIYLLGKNACWGSNTRCLAGTTCNYCCRGSSWRWEWAGDHCN